MWLVPRFCGFNLGAVFFDQQSSTSLTIAYHTTSSFRLLSKATSF
jgi:hypothetical protein